MNLIEEYLAGIEELDKSVDKVAHILDNNNEELDFLTEKLGILFSLFNRGDELGSIIRSTSVHLSRVINNKKSDFLLRENFLKITSKRLKELSQSLRELIDLLNKMRGNAGHFLNSAQTLIYLAKNTEIKAYRSRHEGKGLAIIARQVYSLACNARIPLQKFGKLLDGLSDLTAPYLAEMTRVMGISQNSAELLSRSIASLKMIDGSITALRKIIVRIEDDKEVFRHLKESVQAGLELLKNQLFYSRNAMDDLSIRSSQMSSSAHNLKTLYELLTEPGHNSNFYVINQFKYLFDENRRIAEKLSVERKAPVFPEELVRSITDIDKRLSKLHDSIQSLDEFERSLGSGMEQIIDYENQIQSFFQKMETTAKNLDKLFNRLTKEFDEVDKFTREIGKVLGKLKSLTMFAKIEQGRSRDYHNIIMPVVQEFVHITQDTENVLAQIEELIYQCKVLIQSTKTEIIFSELPSTADIPEYSKIKIFVDEIIRVFKEQLNYIRSITDWTRDFDEKNRKLIRQWREYKFTVKSLVDMTVRLSDIPELHYPAPAAIIRKRRVLRINIVDDPITLKPDLRTDSNSHKVICNFSTGLFQFGEGVELNFGICDDYEISEDGKEYILKIREGVKYHNGEKLKIEHIKDAFIKALSGPDFGFFNMIQGAHKFSRDKKQGVSGVEIIDNHTLRIKLEYPFLPILSNLATNIVDPYIDDELPAGVGPFRLVAWDKGRRIVLEAFDEYFEGRPSVDELHFLIVNENEAHELFLQGKLDIYQPSLAMFSRMNLELKRLRQSVAELSTNYICINCQKKPFDDKLVRKAIAYAVDQEYLVKNFMPEGAIPARGVFPPSMRVFNRRLTGYNYDPAKARELLREAGYKNGLSDSYPFDIVNAEPVIECCEYIKDCLEKIGIKIELNPLPSDIMLEKTFTNRSILSLRGWLSDNGDPDNFLFPLFHTQAFGRTGNTFFFSNPEIDKKIEQARRIRNLNGRIALYRKIEEMILDECPGVFLSHSVQNILLQKYVLGFKIHPLGLIRGKYVVLKERKDADYFARHRTSRFVGLRT